MSDGLVKRLREKPYRLGGESNEAAALRRQKEREDGADLIETQSARIAELEAALATARREGMEEAAKLVETHVYTVSNFEPQFRLTPDNRAKDDMHHTTIAAAIRAALEGGKKDEREA